MFQSFHIRGISDQVDDILCCRYDEKQLVLMTKNVKQAGGDICQHSVGKGLLTCGNPQLVKGEMEEGKGSNIRTNKRVECYITSSLLSSH